MNTSPTVSKSSLVKELEGGEGQWVTIHGNPVFIQSGQSVSEAFKAHAEKVEKQKQQVLPGVMAKASAAIKAGKGGKSVDPTYHAYGLYWEAKVAYESSKGTPGEKAAYEKMITAKGVHKSIANDVKSGKIKIDSLAPAASTIPTGTAGGTPTKTYLPNPTPNPTKPVTTAPLPPKVAPAADGTSKKGYPYTSDLTPSSTKPVTTSLPTSSSKAMPTADMSINQLKSVFDNSTDVEIRKAASSLIIQKSPDASLTPKEIERYAPGQYTSIQIFTASGYSFMNQNPDHGDSKRFLQGMTKLQTFKDKVTLYRGMKFDSKVHLEEFVDSISEAPSYTIRRTGQSFSISDKIADKFSAGHSNRATLILEEHSTGRDIRPFSYHKEQEIVFLRGTRFKATKVEVKTDSYGETHAKIYIKEIGSRSQEV